MTHADILMEATFAALEHRQSKWYADFWTVERCWIVERDGRLAIVVTRDGRRMVVYESSLHDSRESAETAHWNEIMEARAKFEEARP